MTELGTHDQDTILVDPNCSMEDLIMRLWHEGQHVMNALGAGTEFDPYTDTKINSQARCNHAAMYVAGAWVVCEICCSGLTCNCNILGETFGNAGLARSHCPAETTQIPDPEGECCCTY